MTGSQGGGRIEQLCLASGEPRRLLSLAHAAAELPGGNGTARPDAADRAGVPGLRVPSHHAGAEPPRLRGQSQACAAPDAPGQPAVSAQEAYRARPPPISNHGWRVYPTWRAEWFRARPIGCGWPTSPTSGCEEFVYLAVVSTRSADGSSAGRWKPITWASLALRPSEWRWKHAGRGPAG